MSHAVSVHTSTFLCQTFTMLSEALHPDAVHWGGDGSSVVVSDVSARSSRPPAQPRRLPRRRSFAPLSRVRVTPAVADGRHCASLCVSR